MREFEYVTPSSLEEACRLLAERPGATALAGGTDVMIFLQQGKMSPSILVDLSRIPGLDVIEEKDGSVEIGALVSMTSLMRSEVVQRLFPALAKAAGSMGCWQVRNRATLGGNLCNASPSADTVPPLLLHDAVVTAAGPNGRREIDIAGFAAGPGATALETGEIVTGVVLPKPPSGLRSTYLRRQIRRSMDIPLVNVAVAVGEQGGIVCEARVCLGAVAPVPFPVHQAEGLLCGRPLTAESIREAADAAARNSRPITDVRSTASYRAEMVKIHVRRGLESLVEGGLQ